jgi:hypothetical protein
MLKWILRCECDNRERARNRRSLRLETLEDRRVLAPLADIEEERGRESLVLSVDRLTITARVSQS